MPQRPAPHSPARRLRSLISALCTGAAVAACSGLGAPAGPAASGPTTEATPVPPAPPAACLLDVGKLSGDTGIGWAPDLGGAGDTRCVYDPAGNSAELAFLTVEIASVATDPKSELAAVAQACADGSQTTAGVGFVCQFRGGGPMAAFTRTDRLISITAAAVPPGTTADRLGRALTRQVETLSGSS